MKYSRSHFSIKLHKFALLFNEWKIKQKLTTFSLDVDNLWKIFAIIDNSRVFAKIWYKSNQKNQKDYMMAEWYLKNISQINILTNLVESEVQKIIIQNHKNQYSFLEENEDFPRYSDDFLWDDDK